MGEATPQSNDTQAECAHENTEFDPGNYVPPYGWEIHPGVYCLDCGDMIDTHEETEL